MTINGDAKAARIVATNRYDAIVIGSGISGGWAAKELCEKGLRTLVLERGRDVRHLVDYPTATMNPWEFSHRNRMPDAFDQANPIATKCYALDESTQQFFVKDAEHPYVQEKPFDWIRGYQVGGKSLIWARQTQRWSKFDFETNARDGAAVDWPIRYEDIAPWYSHVEKFVGISGNKDGLETLPDGEFMKPWELNCVEKHIQKRVAESYQDRNVIIGRCAHLTEPKQIHYDQGRAQCQARHLCYRGCPYGGYFSSNSSTLPWAAKTGKLTLRPDSVVHSIIYDEAKKKATGVRVIDTHTKQMTEYFARIIFVNAACLNSNLILLNSTSRRFPNGLGNDSGLLGHYVAFHNYRGNIIADYDGFEDGYYYGRRPTTAFMPNFRNVRKQEMDFQRGYIVAFSAARTNWHRGASQAGFGADFKDKLSDPGAWTVFMMMQGETVPRYENHVRLSADQKDTWGIPQLVTAIDYTDNDLKMMNDFLVQGAEMLDKAGCKRIKPYDDHRNPGLDIHEMGGVRMGHDPKTSLLNAHNQLHAVKNVFVTDGAAMTSTGNQNPSITFMALTARAANFAVREMKRGNL
ncbi:GMC oxidoreductase [Spirosoma koreense]